MKVIANHTVKYEGKYYPPGSEIDMKDAIAKTCIDKGSVAKPGATPAKPAAETEEAD